MEQWVMAALGMWVVWAEVKALVGERRHGAERRELCARIQAGTIERYDAHVARAASPKRDAERERPNSVTKLPVELGHTRLGRRCAVQHVSQ